MEFAFLKDHPRLIDSLAEAHDREWSHLYTDWDENIAREEFLTQHADGRIPATLLLLDGNTLVGSVSLVMNDLPTHLDLNPWLASLYVFPKYRGQGFAKRLIAVAAWLFAQNGFPTFYLFTETEAERFARLKFRVLEESSLNGFPIAIMQRQ